MKNTIKHLAITLIVVMACVGAVKAIEMSLTAEELQELMGQELGDGMLGGRTSATWTAANLVSEGDLTVSDAATVGKFVQGGGSLTEVSSASNQVLTDTQICTYSHLPIQPIQSINVTLPATSTMEDCLTSAGQMMDIVIENTATTTMNLTIVTGAGMDLQEPDGQNVVIGQNNWAFLTLIKLADGNIGVRVDETIPAD